MYELGLMLLLSNQILSNEAYPDVFDDVLAYPRYLAYPEHTGEKIWSGADIVPYCVASYVRVNYVPYSFIYK